jgi:hypothetical protein
MNAGYTAPRTGEAGALVFANKSCARPTPVTCFGLLRRIREHFLPRAAPGLPLGTAQRRCHQRR